MAEREADAKLTHADLYGLALTLCGGLDPEVVARSFLEGLLAHTPVESAALWRIPCAASTEPSARRFIALPADAAPTSLPPSHALFARPTPGPTRWTAHEPRFAEVAAGAAPGAGVCVVFPLDAEALLVLTARSPEALDDTVVAQLAPVIDRFAAGFRAAMTHAQTTRTAWNQRALLERVSDPLFQVDADGRLQWWNTALLHLTGRPEEALRGAHLADLMAPGAADAAAAVLTQGLEQGHVEATVPLKTPRGQRRHDLGGVRLVGEDGRRTLVAVVHDTEAREAALAALSDREARLQATVRVMVDSPWVLDAATGDLVIARRGADVLAIHDDETPGRTATWRAQVHPDDLGRLSGGVLDLLDGRAQSFTCELRLRDAQGRWRHVEIHAVLAPSTSASDEPPRVVGRLQDISERHAYEKRREQIVSLLQATLESTGDGLVVTDQTGCVVAANRRLGEIWGMPPVYEGDAFDAVLTALCARTVAGEEFAALARAWSASMEGEGQTVLQLPTDRFIECHTRPQRMDGRVTGRVWRFADVTAGEQAARRLREERDLFLSGSVVVFKWGNRPGWPVEYVSANVQNVLGYTPERMMAGEPAFTDIVHPDDGPRILAEIGEHLAQDTHSIAHAPYRLRRADYTYIWVADYTTAQRNAAGEIVSYLGYAIDVTARVEAQASLERERLLLRSLIDSIPDIVFFKDVDGRYQAGNPALARALGQPVGEIVGRTDADLFPPEMAETFQRIDREVLASGVPTRVVERVQAADGRLAEVETLKTPFRGQDGEVLGLIGIARDISERVAAEQSQRAFEAQLRQSQKMEAIGRLTGGIAHDFNNMLAVILGYAGLALDEIGDHALHPLFVHLDEIRRSGIRARDLVAKMLAFSRARPTHDPIAVDPVVTVPEVMRMLRATLPASITVTLEVDPATAPYLGDPVELHQVVTNLVINARDAVDEHGHIAVRVHPAETSGHCATCGEPLFKNATALEVVDDGAGISPDHLARIFDPFFTTKEVGRGTGMGLSVVHGIVHGSGGHVQVVSAPGAGTTARVLFPPTARADGVERVSGQVPLVRLPAVRRHVLLVDDEPALLRLVARTLQKTGYQVSAHTNAREALDAFEAAPESFDAVVSDQSMPELTGRELLSRVLALRPGLPTLLSTGFSDQVDAEVAARMGVRRFLNKPATLKEIVAAVDGLFAPT